MRQLVSASVSWALNMWLNPLKTKSHRRSTLSLPAGPRLEAGAPSLRCEPGTAWQRLMFWLTAPAPHEAAPPLNRLPAVRQEFLAAIADTRGAAACALRCRIEDARSLRELWHLRSDLFRVVGVAHSQHEAECRLARLARHFPIRTPRSTFGAH